MMETEPISLEIPYIRDNIGHVITHCLVDVVQERPDDPIQFMAHWLYHHATTRMYFEDKRRAVVEAQKQVEDEKEASLERWRRLAVMKSRIRKYQFLIRHGSAHFKPWRMARNSFDGYQMRRSESIVSAPYETRQSVEFSGGPTSATSLAALNIKKSANERDPTAEEEIPFGGQTSDRFSQAQPTIAPKMRSRTHSSLLLRESLKIKIQEVKERTLPDIILDTDEPDSNEQIAPTEPTRLKPTMWKGMQSAIRGIHATKAWASWKDTRQRPISNFEVARRTAFLARQDAIRAAQQAAQMLSRASSPSVGKVPSQASSALSSTCSKQSKGTWSSGRSKGSKSTRYNNRLSILDDMDYDAEVDWDEDGEEDTSDETLSTWSGPEKVENTQKVSDTSSTKQKKLGAKKHKPTPSVKSSDKDERKVRSKRPVKDMDKVKGKVWKVTGKEFVKGMMSPHRKIPELSTPMISSTENEAPEKSMLAPKKSPVKTPSISLLNFKGGKSFLKGRKYSSTTKDTLSSKDADETLSDVSMPSVTQTSRFSSMRIEDSPRGTILGAKAENLIEDPFSPGRFSIGPDLEDVESVDTGGRKSIQSNIKAEPGPMLEAPEMEDDESDDDEKSSTSQSEDDDSVEDSNLEIRRKKRIESVVRRGRRKPRSRTELKKVSVESKSDEYSEENFLTPKPEDDDSVKEENFLTDKPEDDDSVEDEKSSTLKTDDDSFEDEKSSTLKTDDDNTVKDLRHKKRKGNVVRRGRRKPRSRTELKKVSVASKSDEYSDEKSSTPQSEDDDSVEEENFLTDKPEDDDSVEGLRRKKREKKAVKDLRREKTEQKASMQGRRKSRSRSDEKSSIPKPEDDDSVKDLRREKTEEKAAMQGRRKSRSRPDEKSSIPKPEDDDSVKGRESPVTDMENGDSADDQRRIRKKKRAARRKRKKSRTGMSLGSEMEEDESVEALHRRRRKSESREARRKREKSIAGTSLGSEMEEDESVGGISLGSDMEEDESVEGISLGSEMEEGESVEALHRRRRKCKSREARREREKSIAGISLGSEMEEDESVEALDRRRGKSESREARRERENSIAERRDERPENFTDEVEDIIVTSSDEKESIDDRTSKKSQRKGGKQTSMEVQRRREQRSRQLASPSKVQVKGRKPSKSPASASPIDSRSTDSNKTTSESSRTSSKYSRVLKVLRHESDYKQADTVRSPARQDDKQGRSPSKAGRLKPFEEITESKFSEETMSDTRFSDTTTESSLVSSTRKKANLDSKKGWTRQKPSIEEKKKPVKGEMALWELVDSQLVCNHPVLGSLGVITPIRDEHTVEEWCEREFSCYTLFDQEIYTSCEDKLVNFQKEITTARGSSEGSRLSKEPIKGFKSIKRNSKLKKMKRSI